MEYLYIPTYFEYINFNERSLKKCKECHEKW